MFKLGDRVRIISNSGVGRYPVGHIGKITFVDTDKAYRVDSGPGNWYSEEDLKLAKEDKRMFKIGDRVTVVNQQYKDMNSIGYAGVIKYISSISCERQYQLSNDYWYNAGELKEANKMTKDDLKNGMLVQHKNGRWGFIQLATDYYGKQKDLIIDYKWLSQLSVETLNEALEYGDWTIQKIATVDYVGDLFHAIQDGAKVESIGGFKVIWERQNPKVQQLESLVSKLESQLKEAQDELKEIQA